MKAIPDALTPAAAEGFKGEVDWSWLPLVFLKTCPRSVSLQTDTFI